jgi:glycosyltransferase involved in cell wall biosynthesis
LIEAVRGTDIHLKVSGRGNAEESLTTYIQTENISNVEMLGFKKKDEIFALTQHASFGVCPSEWYENYPFSISETFLFSKPVVGSNIGGIPELVIDGQTGLLFEAGNQLQLREKLLLLWNDEDLVNKLGQQARKHSYDLFNYETHWNMIFSVIQRLALQTEAVSSARI